ncbi:hypothetical protein KAJ27_18775 [bacterium]|nr:hypothetical protein [bacterium]
MNLILFIHKDSLETGVVLKNTIETKFCDSNLQIIDTFNSLKSRLKSSFGNGRRDILILLGESQERLAQLISLTDLMEGKQIVLIIPDESKKSLSKASRFFPRFFTPIKDEYDDLCIVIDKMVKRDSNNI